MRVTNNKQSLNNYIAFNKKGRREFSNILDRIAISAYLNPQDYLIDLDNLLSNKDNYDQNYVGDLKTSLESSSIFARDDIYDVIDLIVYELDKVNPLLVKNVDFLENMGFWDFITALWLKTSKLLPSAALRNWGSIDVYKDIEKKRHPFKGPGILYILHQPNIGIKPKLGVSTMSFACLKFYINGTITKRGEIQEQLFFRNWVVPQDKLLLAIHGYMTKNSLPMSSIRDVIADLSELNTIIDFSGFSDHLAIEKLIDI